MPGVLCQGDNSSFSHFRTITDIQNGDHTLPSLVDSESGIDDSGDSEYDQHRLAPHPPGVDLNSSDDPPAAEVPPQSERESDENDGQAVPILGDDELRHCIDRRTSLQIQHSADLQSVASHSAPLQTQHSADLQSVASHSAPSTTSEHLAAFALQSALSTCALPTIRVGQPSQDVSQGDSNVEDGSQRLPSLYEVNTPSDVTKNITNKSPSKTPSPQLHYYPHSPPPPPPQVNGESPQPQELKELLTDISDINESDHEIEKPTGPFTEIVVCPNISTHHQGREVINIVYALPIDILFTLLFTNSKFMLDLHTTRKTYDVVHSPWQSNPETNQKIRQVTYTLTLPTNSFGPKVSHVTETQVIASFSKPCELYTVDAEACNSGIPYADSFFVSNHWCLTREANNETRLAVWSEVKYKKNVWGFMKNVIDKNAFSGMEGLMSDLNASLMEEVDRTNQKRTRRRRRRAGSKTIDVTDPLLQIPIPGDKIKDIHKSTQMPSRKLHIPSVSMEVPCSPLKTSVRTAALLFLCILLAVNAFLYYRLYALEERVVNGVTSRNLGFDSSIFKVAGRDDEIPVEEWVQILHQQESLHSAEVERWRKAVSEAAEYLKKAEESLRGLHASIPNSQASKMQALLQHLQLLQQMQEKRFATKFESKAAKNDDNKIDLEMESEEEWQKTNSKQPEEL